MSSKMFMSTSIVAAGVFSLEFSLPQVAQALAMSKQTPMPTNTQPAIYKDPDRNSNTASTSVTISVKVNIPPNRETTFSTVYS